MQASHVQEEMQRLSKQHSHLQRSASVLNGRNLKAASWVNYLAEREYRGDQMYIMYPNDFEKKDWLWNLKYFIFQQEGLPSGKLNPKCTKPRELLTTYINLFKSKRHFIGFILVQNTWDFLTILSTQFLWKSLPVLSLLNTLFSYYSIIVWVKDNSSTGGMADVQLGEVGRINSISFKN